MDYEQLRDRFEEELRGTLKGDHDAHEMIIDELVAIVEELVRRDRPDKLHRPRD